MFMSIKSQLDANVVEKEVHLLCECETLPNLDHLDHLNPLNL